LAKFAGAAPLPSLACGLGTLRTALVSGAALSLLAGFVGPADAAPRGYFSPYGWYGGYRGYYTYPSYAPSRRARAAPTYRDKGEPRKEAGFGEMPKGPLQIVVSIDSQKVTLFSNGVRVAQGPVSTGVPGHPTPMGVFSIIEKDRYHHSNIYSNAPMPFMQRITWSGVALHEGVLPGYPASHGCIRMSHDFAQKLWPVTQLGVRVIVARSELAPADFAHPKLFVPKLKPAEPQIATNGMTDGRDLVPPMVVAQAAVNAEDDAARTLPGAAPPEPAPADGDLVKPAPTVDPAKPIAPRLKSADQLGKRSGQVAVFVSRKEMKIFVRQGMLPLFDMPLAIDEPDKPLGTHVFTAMSLTDNGAGMRWNLMTVANDLSLPPSDPREARRKLKEPPRPILHLKPPSSAAEALNRIQMPKEAVERISELLIPGSSLVVSDEGLGRETGRYTEFIVLTR
jgi:L,D-transpeptidase catalytic domain